MPAHVIIGAQWGDEGKGRVADWLAANADIVARYGGGDNAGHTVWANDEMFKLHIVPSGVIHSGVRCVMGNGMVINPLKLMDELKALDERGIDISPDRIALSDAAHVITPAHIALDGAGETARGSDAIGTTRRGIGPAYADKYARTGVRTGSMRNPAAFIEAINKLIDSTNRVLVARYDAKIIDQASAQLDQYHAAAQFLAPYLADTPLLLHSALKENKVVLCEGAQGTLLDIDHGIYPFVTSSSPTVGGAITGLGITPQAIEKVIGVVKAYSTRVGGGPFPTELEGDLGDKLRGTGANPWDEFGTTTGRPRRCGWLDTVVVRYAARISGLTELVVTKLDILSGFDRVQIADRYADGEDVLAEVPTNLAAHERCKPVYEELSGWSEDTTAIRSFEQLPVAARDYISRIETLAGLPAKIITVGPNRDQTIARN